MNPAALLPVLLVLAAGGMIAMQAPTNALLARQFDTIGFPTFIALDRNGTEIWRMPAKDDPSPVIDLKLYQPSEFISLLEILKGAEMPTTGLLWDAHHTVVAGKEPPADTFKQLSRYIRHTHLKDSKPEGKDVRYVLTGTGTLHRRA